MLLDLLRYAPSEEVQWLVVFFRDGPLVEEVQSLGIETRVVETGRLRQLHRYIQSIGRLIKITRQEDIDLILSWSGKSQLYGGVAAFLANVPAVWYQLGYPVGRHLGFMDRLATLIPASAIVTLSQSAQKGQEALWPSRQTYLVYPSVRLNQFNPDRLSTPPEARRKLDLPTEGPLIGMVSRLQRWKGVHVLVEAMPRVLAQHPEAHAVIVGGEHDLEPDYLPFLKKKILTNGLKDRIILAGFQADVPTWMQAMDVVVHASDNEPFGIVIIEAMALGKPVVAGNKGGPTEIIREGENGLLAPYGDERALAQQIRRLLSHPEWSRKLGAAARKRALQFGPKRYARRLTDVLHDAVTSIPSSNYQDGVSPAG